MVLTSVVSMPPPKAKSTVGAGVNWSVVMLLLTVVLSSVIIPKLAIPPPRGSERVQPDPQDVLAVAMALFSVMTLSPIATVASRHPVDDEHMSGSRVHSWG